MRAKCIELACWLPFYSIKYSSSRAQWLINLEITVLVRSLSQAMLSLVSTGMGDCSSVARVLLLAGQCRLGMNGTCGLNNP